MTELHYYGADWCPACVAAKPAVLALAAAHDVPLHCFDVTDEMVRAQAKALGFRAVPGLVVYRDGQPVHRSGGALLNLERAAAVLNT